MMQAAKCCADCPVWAWLSLKLYEPVTLEVVLSWACRMKGLEQTFKTDISLKSSTFTFARGGLECVSWDFFWLYLALWYNLCILHSTCYTYCSLVWLSCLHAKNGDSVGVHWAGCSYMHTRHPIAWTLGVPFDFPFFTWFLGLCTTSADGHSD